MPQTTRTNRKRSRTVPSQRDQGTSAKIKAPVSLVRSNATGSHPARCKILNSDKRYVVGWSIKTHQSYEVFGAKIRDQINKGLIQTVGEAREAFEAMAAGS